MAKLCLSGRYYRAFPPERFLGHTEEQLTLETDQTAFLVVDVYGLGFSPDDEGSPHAYPSMSLAASFEKEKDIVVNQIRPALDAARATDLHIVFVNNSAPRIAMNESELAKVARRTCDLDWEEWGSEEGVDPREYHHGDSTALKFSRVIEPKPEDYFIRKHAYSGFFQTRLDGLLRNLGVKNLVCVGFALDICLGCTMVDAMNLNYRVVLLRDCTMALEMPWEVEELLHTKRMTLWTEICVGYTATAGDFVAACSAVSR